MAENGKYNPGNSGGRTYYINIPVRPLSAEVEEEHLERLTLYYTAYGLLIGLIGVLAIVIPLLFGIEILMMLAWLLVIGGAVTLLQFILMCGAPGTTSFLLVGAMHLAAGIFILLQPAEANKRFFFLFAAWFFIHGCMKVMMAWQVSKVTTWPAVLVSGLVSICLAVVVLIITSRFGLELVAIFFGADLIGTGLALLMIAFMAFLGRGNRAVSDLDSRNEPLMHGRGPPAAALDV